MDVRLGQLRTLLAVADAGTFTDAAAVLGVSQATVSRSVAALERAFGARLVQRTTRHVALTATGTRIVAQARRIVEEVAHLQRIVDAARTEVLLGYAWAALGRHTRRLQKIWAAAHPGVPLVFVQANDPTAGLSDGTADIAVIRRPLDDDRFATVEIGLESRYAAVATDSALARRRSLRVEDLSRYTVAIDSRTGTTTLDLWPPDARLSRRPRDARGRRVADAHRRRPGRRRHVRGDRAPVPAAGRGLPGAAARAAHLGAAGVVA
nr:hypothetical protein GCM10020092_011490 [Actinoplanes digitatis]